MSSFFFQNDDLKSTFNKIGTTWAVAALDGKGITDLPIAVTLRSCNRTRWKFENQDRSEIEISL